MSKRSIGEVDGSNMAGPHQPPDFNAKKQRDMPEAALKMCMNNAMAAAVIGKGGANVQMVQAQSGALVRVSNTGMYLPGTQDRVVLITGSFDAVHKASAFVLNIAHQLNGGDTATPFFIAPEANTTEVVQKLLVPTTASGLIIGKGGANVKELSQGSGARINLEPKQESASERTMVVTGTLNSVRVCIDLLLAKFAQDPPLAHYVNMSTNYNTPGGGGGGYMQHQHAAATYGGMGGGMGHYGNPAAHILPPVGADAITVTVSVADNMVGGILGKKGSILNDMQTMSGARIKISQKGEYVPGTTERIITIIGAPASAQMAQHLVTQRVLTLAAAGGGGHM